jgi:Protein of unknown function (DUF1570)
MARMGVFLVGVVLAATLLTEVRGDFLIYRPWGGGQGGRGRGFRGQSGGPNNQGPRGMQQPGQGGMSGQGASDSASDLEIVLPGKATFNGRIVSFQHTTFKEQLNFSVDEVEVKRTPTTMQQYGKILGQAGKDPDAILKAGLWALKKGLLDQFYAAADKALEIDPKHEAAARIKALKKQMDRDLPVNPATENELRSIISRQNMKIETSKHFILLHDTPTKAEAGHRKNRAKERLDLLEKVYESFMLLFHAQDIQLDIPQERMKVVLFQEYNDFHEYATGLSPALASAAGFWEPIRNVSYFYDHGTTDTFKALEKLQDELEKVSDEAKRNRERSTIILVKTINLLIAVEKENSDITVVSHEATHQMAGNTGLLPRHVEIPRWVHEGLATYFEAPGDATWAGIGAVNETRLTYYRALDKDRVHSNIDFIVEDQIFDFARSHGAVLHGYGQAWALTHFMLENHIKEFVAFYRMLGEMLFDVALNPDLLQQLFSRVFGSDHKPLDQEWRSYMRSLKTDMERMEELAEKKK